MPVKNRMVDFRQGFLWRKSDIEHAEQRNETRVHLITTTTRLEEKNEKWSVKR